MKKIGLIIALCFLTLNVNATVINPPSISSDGALSTPGSGK